MKEIAYQLEFIPLEAKVALVMIAAALLAFVAARRRS
jgi:hypothetical protein